MLTEEQVREGLEEVLVPGVKRSLVGLNLVREVIVLEQRVKISLASAALSSGVQDWIKTKTQAVVEKLPDVNEVEIEFSEAKPAELNQIDHIIAVMSGKGGVGR